MISPEQRQLLQELPRTPFGQALKAFLDDQYALIGDIRQSKSWEETLGRSFALNVLDDLFAFMGNQKTGGKGRNQYT